MQTITPSDFLARWPGSLRPIALPKPGPKLPRDCRRLLTKFGLPAELTIRCYNDTTLRFTGVATPLADIWQRKLEQGLKLDKMPADWNRFWHLGDTECVQISTWLCVEEGSGRLVVIDLGHPRNPIYLMNSSVGNFYTTLAYFLEWSEKSDGSSAETTLLRDALLRQQCIAPAELKPFWMDFVEFTIDSDPSYFAVELGRTDA
jgi:hypothetical protein